MKGKEEITLPSLQLSFQLIKELKTRLKKIRIFHLKYFLIICLFLISLTRKKHLFEFAIGP